MISLLSQILLLADINSIIIVPTTITMHYHFIDVLLFFSYCIRPLRRKLESTLFDRGEGSRNGHTVLEAVEGVAAYVALYGAKEGNKNDLPYV